MIYTCSSGVFRVQSATRCVIWLVASKSRVAPICSHTIPQQELLSVLLLPELLFNIMAPLEAKLKLGAAVCYTDSNV